MKNNPDSKDRVFYTQRFPLDAEAVKTVVMNPRSEILISEVLHARKIAIMDILINFEYCYVRRRFTS